MSTAPHPPARSERPPLARIAFWVAMAVIWIALALVSMDTFGKYSEWADRIGVACIALISGLLWYLAGRHERRAK